MGGTLRSASGPRAARSSLPKTFYHSCTQKTFIGHLSCAETMLGSGDAGMSGTDGVPVPGKRRKIRRKKNELENAR